MPHAPRGLLGGLWGACMAALALKSPSDNFLARLIAKGTLVSLSVSTRRYDLPTSVARARVE